MRRIISNTSCLIALSNIKRLDILQKLYGTIVVTPEVQKEFGEILPDWISVVPVSDPDKTKLIQGTLDLGESSSIALAIESEESLLILDDRKARRFAQTQGLELTGTLGVVVKSIHSGIIDEEVTTILNEFRSCGFHIPSEIDDLFS